MAERIDNIGFGNLKLIQDSDEFCYGVDAVILADFAAKTAKKKDSFVDLGTGTGVIPLILSYKTDAERIIGVEVQESQFKKAVRNAELNGLGDRVSFMNLNVKDVKGISASNVTCNPPYAKEGSAIQGSMSSKAIARHEILGNIEDFMKSAAGILENRGELFMVHRPSRLADIFAAAKKYRLEPKTMRMVSPGPLDAPNIVLIHFIKGAGSELKVMKPLNVYDENGEFSIEINNIYEREKK